MSAGRESRGVCAYPNPAAAEEEHDRRAELHAPAIPPLPSDRKPRGRGWGRGGMGSSRLGLARGGGGAGRVAAVDVVGADGGAGQEEVEVKLVLRLAVLDELRPCRAPEERQSGGGGGSGGWGAGSWHRSSPGGGRQDRCPRLGTAECGRAAAAGGAPWWSQVSESTGAQRAKIRDADSAVVHCCNISRRKRTDDRR